MKGHQLITADGTASPAVPSHSHCCRPLLPGCIVRAHAWKSRTVSQDDPPRRTPVVPPLSLRPHDPHNRPNKSPTRAPVSGSPHPEGPALNILLTGFFPSHLILLTLAICPQQVIILYKNQKSIKCIFYFLIFIVSGLTRSWLMQNKVFFLCRGSKICCHHRFGSPSCESCVTGSQLSCPISATCKKFWPLAKSTGKRVFLRKGQRPNLQGFVLFRNLTLGIFFSRVSVKTFDSSASTYERFQTEGYKYCCVSASPAQQHQHWIAASKKKPPPILSRGRQIAPIWSMNRNPGAISSVLYQETDLAHFLQP